MLIRAPPLPFGDWSDLPAETEHHNDEKIDDSAGNFSVRQACDHHMRKRAGKNKEYPDDEEHSDPPRVYGIGRIGVAVETDRKVPADETKHGGKLF